MYDGLKSPPLTLTTLTLTRTTLTLTLTLIACGPNDDGAEMPEALRCVSVNPDMSELTRVEDE